MTMRTGIKIRVAPLAVVAASMLALLVVTAGAPADDPVEVGADVPMAHTGQDEASPGGPAQGEGTTSPGSGGDGGGIGDNPGPCPADLTDDGFVDVQDMIAVITRWGPCPIECFADLNGDGMVNVLDLLIVILNWGVCD